MTSYSLSKITQFTQGELSGNPEVIISDLAYDSRNLVAPRSSLFFALQSQKNDGHKYIKNAFDKGVRAFVVTKDFKSELDASFIRVNNTLKALQLLAKAHRETFKNPVIGITGSNGKTTVKEWLSRILSSKYDVAASPRSFNSKLGVPLSLWQIDNSKDLAIIEAGISHPGEMEVLEEMIQPDIGVFTHVGDAHLKNFHSQKHLIEEKIKLFAKTKTVIVHSEHAELVNALVTQGNKLLKLGENETDDFRLKKTTEENRLQISIKGIDEDFNFFPQMADKASVNNMCIAAAVSQFLEIKPSVIKNQLSLLEPLDMRVQVLKGINNCILLNDSYTADISALENALDLSLKFTYGRDKTLIISDFENGKTAQNQLEKLLVEKEVNRLITIGETSKSLQNEHKNRQHFKSVEHFLETDLQFKDEVIIIKGARAFKLEQIANRLQLKDHQTVLEVNLNAFTENLEYFRAKLSHKTKIMAMVKAFSYGTGSFEVAKHLENAGVDYLAVAYADEGVELRKNGVQLPILVLNPEPSAFDTIIRYQLEPEIYSLELLVKFQEVLELQGQKKFPIHIKLDTGMHRLGIEEKEINQLLESLKTNFIELKSVFSHLAASDSAEHDQFTNNQIKKFDKCSSRICDTLNYQPLRHICNSSAISRFPEAHFDMVRLGIGLYGVSSDTSEQTLLKLAGKLKSTIIQTRTIESGESIGYNRSFIAKEKTRVGIIPIGYADGLFRSLGNNKIQVTIGNQRAPIIGNICMDMAFLDLTKTDAQPGSEVTIFQNISDIISISRAAGTIPYEVLSAISHRVKRSFFIE